MQKRPVHNKAYPEALEAMLALSQAVQKTGLAPQLIDLINYRVSQLNGCASCLDMHSKDLRARGEDEQRLHLLAAWRDAPVYSDRERAALAWTEGVTRLPHGEVPDAVYAETRRHFGDKELVDLTLAITAINAWNRLNIRFRSEVGSYQPPHQHRRAA